MPAPTYPYLLVTLIVFSVVSLIHLIRAINQWPFVIGPYELPISVSWIGFAITGALAVWAATLIAKST